MSKVEYYCARPVVNTADRVFSQLLRIKKLLLTSYGVEITRILNVVCFRVVRYRKYSATLVSLNRDTTCLTPVFECSATQVRLQFGLSILSTCNVWLQEVAQQSGKHFHTIDFRWPD
jgi:hypothetical protein